jgi:hypothetical protein
VLTKLSAYHWNWIFIHCSLVLTFLNYSSVTSVVLLLITCLNWTIAASAHGETIVLVLVLVECGDEAIQCSELLNRLRLQREDSDPWHQIWLNPYINFFTKFWEGLQNMYNHAVISLSLLVIKHNSGLPEGLIIQDFTPAVHMHEQKYTCWWITYK